MSPASGKADGTVPSLHATLSSFRVAFFKLSLRALNKFSPSQKLLAFRFTKLRRAGSCERCSARVNMCRGTLRIRIVYWVRKVTNGGG